MPVTSRVSDRDPGSLYPHGVIGLPHGGGVMELGEAILAVGAGDRAPSFELFSETLDAAWIAQALQATGTATIRRRKLPAEYVVWLVIGMALLRDRSIREVVRHLDLVLPTRAGRGTVSGAAPFGAGIRRISPFSVTFREKGVHGAYVLPACTTLDHTVNQIRLRWACGFLDAFRRKTPSVAY